MVQILSRMAAMLVATLLVAVGGWALMASYYVDVFGGHGQPICDCFWFIPSFDDTAHWQTLDTGRFRMQTPAGASVYRQSLDIGAVEDYRYTLAYALVSGDDGGAFATSGSDYREESVIVGGKPALLRSAYFKGRADPLFLQLVVPRAVKAKDGRWLTLEIHGFLRTGERAWLADRILRTVDFSPPFDVPVRPPRPFVAMPTIEIENSDVR